MLTDRFILLTNRHLLKKSQKMAGEWHALPGRQKFLRARNEDEDQAGTKTSFFSEKRDVSCQKLTWPAEPARLVIEGPEGEK